MKTARSTIGGRRRRYRALSPPERRLFRAAWWALLVSDLELRFAERRSLEAAMAPPAPAPSRTARPPAPAAAGELQKVAQAVASAAANHLWPMNCLPRSLALKRLLAKRGIASTFRIGVRKDFGELQAHAWIEVDGVPLGEPEAIEARFLPLGREGP